MSKKKLSKNQKRKKRKKEKEKKSRRILIDSEERLKPWEPPKMKLFRIPEIVPEGLSREKRIDLLRSIGKNAKKSLMKNIHYLKNGLINTTHYICYLIVPVIFLQVLKVPIRK